MNAPSAPTSAHRDPAGPPDWVSERFGVRLHQDGHSQTPLDELVTLGLRRNRRRAHLLVSTVLGKHIPTAPDKVRAGADSLGAAVIELLGGSTARRSTVLGFAETATGLGHGVAHRIDAQVYLHSTRRHRQGVAVSGSFEEGHSHATTHLLQPSSAELLTHNAEAPLVLVDDEISTGATALRAISQLHQLFPRHHYVIASLVDLRTAAHRSAADRLATELGVRIESVALAQGSITLPDTLVDDVWNLAADTLNPLCANRSRGTCTEVTIGWPAHVPDGGRHGFTREDSPAFDIAARAAAAQVQPALRPERPVVVVGHEELMYLPLVIAEELSAAGFAVRYQTTTRSPAHVRDVEGYPLRRGFSFIAPESDPGTPRYVYNLIAPGSDRAAEPPQVLLVIDSAADTPELRAHGGLLDVLSAAGHDVVLAVIPATEQHILAAQRARR